MDSYIKELNDAIVEIDKLKIILKKKKSVIVESRNEKDLVKAVAWAWIKNHRPVFGDGRIDFDITNELHSFYCKILEGADRRFKRSTYLGLIKSVKSLLIKLKTNIVSGKLPIILKVQQNSCPDFSTLISDKKMIDIFVRRWAEVESCLVAKAPLAAVIMMGGLLEALFLAKINHLPDKSILFKLKSTPIDFITKKPRNLSDWMLKDFIDTLSEAGLIRDLSAKFSRSIRDYRNFVHPERELRTGIEIINGDAELCWSVSVALIRQILG